MRTAKDYNEAIHMVCNGFEIDPPYGWLQWKGTDVCIDIRCPCGWHGHLDGDFLYHVECPECRTVYALNGHIELVKLEDFSGAGCVHRLRDGAWIVEPG